MRLSIITVNRNNSAGLEKTIQSIAGSANLDFEYIIIDGNSSDTSVEVIKKYEKSVSYWLSEPDSGIYNAMNKGIKVSTGDYLLFLNSGDTFEQNIDLHNIIQQLGSNEDLIYFDLVICLKNGMNQIKHYPTLLNFKYFAEDSLPHMATFIKKQLFSEYGLYDEQMKICADWAFFMKAVCGGCSYKHIPECFSVFYDGGISSTHENFRLIGEERNDFIKKEYPLLYSFYADWMFKKQEIYRMKTSKSIRFLQKIGLLKWFNSNI